MAPQQCAGLQWELSGSANTPALCQAEPGTGWPEGSVLGLQQCAGGEPLAGGSGEGPRLGRVGMWLFSTLVSTRPSPSWTRTGMASSTRRTCGTPLLPWVGDQQLRGLGAWGRTEPRPSGKSGYLGTGQGRSHSGREGLGGRGDTGEGWPVPGGYYLGQRRREGSRCMNGPLKGLA